MNYSRRILFVSLFVLLASFVSSATGQGLYTVDTKPPRGFMPTADQLSSPVDNIDAVNGKLHLQIPLASLPRGKAGSGFDLELNYDSHLYDLLPSMHQEVIQNRGPFPIYDIGSIVSGGGWTYNFRNYHLELEIRQDADLSNTCPSDENVRVYRLRVSLGDGSLHVLHLRGSGNETDLDTYRGDGFFQVAPNGRPSACGARNGVPIQGGWLTYYTSDGSFLKLETYADGSGSSWSAQPWYLFFPDGRRIASRVGTMELYDPNGNRIRFVSSCVDFPTCTQPYSLILDSSNHEIRLDYTLDTNNSRVVKDVITAQGPNGAITWTVNWETLRIGGNGRKFLWSDGDQLPYGELDILHNVIRYIQLPLAPPVSTPSNAPTWNSYEFLYSDNSVGGFGELAYMRTPTGSQYTYRYRLQTETGICNEQGVCASRDIVQHNWVSRKAISHDGMTDDLVWTYRNDQSGKRIVKNPDGSEVGYWAHPLSGDWKSGLVYQIDEPNGSIRKRVWAQNVAWGLKGGITLYREPNNPYIQKETVSVGNSAGPSKTAVIDYAYDKNGNLLQRTEYDWVAYNSDGPENGTTIRRSTTLIYYKVASPSTATLTDDANAYWRPQSPPPPTPTTPLQVPPVRRLNAHRRSVISDGATVFAVTEFEYDDPLTKGNVTAEKRWDSVKSASVPGLGLLQTSNAQVLTRSYDVYGNLTDLYEPVVRTHITYDPGADVPVRVDYAYGTSSQRSWQYSWTSNSATITAKTDIDNSISTLYTYDNVGRQRTATEAGLRKTETVYDDVNLKVTVKGDLASLNDGKLQTTTEYDQLSRPIIVRTTEPGNPDGIKVKTIYLSAADRVIRSTPYRTTSDATLEWTCTQMDELNRVISVATFKGSTPPGNCEDTTNRTGITRTAYDAEWTTVTDPTMKVRREKRDALGRLVQVTEDPSGLNYDTFYSFDPLDNLTQVLQGVQTRTFQYSSLSRLRIATNPESGTTNYTYNDSGDLTTRMDARGVVTTLGYDPMHRIASKTYSNGPASTPAATYVYYLAASSASPKVGHLQSVSSSIGSAQYDSYDNLGRVTASTHGISGYPGTLSFSYAYWLNDGLKTLTYPSGHVLNYSADDAGRPVKVYTATKTYADLTGGPTAYTADGRLAQMRLGNELWETRSYQAPGASTIFKLGTSAGANDRLQLEYNYSATQNNGNLISHTISQPGRTWTQTYGYDSLNRIASVNEGSAWNQTFGCDRYGNCWLASVNSLTGTDIHQPTVSTNFDPTTNRLYVMNSAFDAAGNQTHYAPYTLAYDAENRNVSATSSANGTGTFAYDADGRRIKKTWTSGGATATTYYFYDALGQLASEYSTQAAVSTGTSYIHTDLLGSVRMVTGEKPASGQAPVFECYDYLPYGRLLNSGDNGRNTGCYPVSPDTQLTSRLPQKFTGKERDTETKLDFFGARYLSASQGRFISPDSISGDTQNPQSWNKYSYTFDNPLRYVDSNGKWPSEIHRGLLFGAFGGPFGMPAKQVALMNEGSLSVDWSVRGQTLPSRGYQHGMRGQEGAAEARLHADAFISEHEENAFIATFWLGSIDGRALREFGVAMHPVMDRTSPAHGGEQVFEGVPSKLSNLTYKVGILMELAGILAHNEKESKISHEVFRNTVDEMRRQYIKTFGKKAFKAATGCDDVSKCWYNYDALPAERWED